MYVAIFVYLSILCLFVLQCIVFILVYLFVFHIVRFSFNMVVCSPYFILQCVIMMFWPDLQEWEAARKVFFGTKWVENGRFGLKIGAIEAEWHCGPCGPVFEFKKGPPRPVLLHMARRPPGPPRRGFPILPIHRPWRPILVFGSTIAKSVPELS